MKDKSNFELSDKAKGEVNAIKENIQDIIERVGNLKGESVEVLIEDYDQLVAKMYDLKNKVVNNGTVRAIDWYVHKHPVKSALYCLGGGILLSMLLRK